MSNTYQKSLLEINLKKMQKLKKLLESLDQFGVPYQQKIVEDRIYKSLFGGVISLIIYSLGLSYSVYILAQWANDSFLPNIQSKSVPINKNTSYALTQNPLKLELGLQWKDNQHRDPIDVFTSNTDRYFLSQVVQQNNIFPDLNTMYLGQKQSDCSPDFDHTDAACLNITQKPNTISQFQDGSSQNIVMLVSLCQNQVQKFCANQQKILQFLNMTQQILFFSVTVQQYDPQTRQIVTIARRENIIMNSKFMVAISVVLQLQEIYITDGGIFPNTDKVSIISDFKLIAQAVPGGLDTTSFYAGKFIQTAISLDKIKVITQVQFVQIGQVLAQIGSILSILLFLQYVVIFINQSRLYETVTMEVLKVYYPEIKQRKITIDIIGRVKSIEGMTDSETQLFFNSNKEFANQKLSLISQLQSLVQLQWALLNFYPTSYLKLLQNQSLGGNTNSSFSGLQKVYPDSSSDGGLMVLTPKKDSMVSEGKEDIRDFFFNVQQDSLPNVDLDRDTIPLELKLDRVRKHLIQNQRILNDLK